MTLTTRLVLTSEITQTTLSQKGVGVSLTPNEIAVNLVGTGVRGETGPQGLQGPQGPQGPQGVQGLQGTAGVGVPTGGATDQVLVKSSNTDYDTEWKTITSGGGFEQHFLLMGA